MLVAAVTVTVGCGASADSPEVKLERARILMQRDQAAEAIPLLNEVIDATPKDPEARYQRGVAYESLSVLEKALIDYTECLTLNPERTDALNNKAVVLAKMKRFEDAAAEFTRLVDLDHRDLWLIAIADSAILISAGLTTPLPTMQKPWNLRQIGRASCRERV